MLLSDLEFASYLTYSPRGTDENALKSQARMYDLKNERSFGNPQLPMSEFITKKIKDEINRLPFKDFFGPEVSLVPVPKSSLIQPGSLWVPERIVNALSKLGLGKPCICLERVKPIPKAATSKPENRPTPMDHYNSMQVKSVLDPSEIVLIDDIVTSGAALLGSASLLRKAFPNVPIKGFAVMRTMSGSSVFKEIVDPCIGKIIFRGNGTTRLP